MKNISFLLLFFLCSCATQYVPTQHIEISCTLPPRCEQFKIINQLTEGQDIYDNFKTAKLCQINTNIYLDCMDKMKKIK